MNAASLNNDVLKNNVLNNDAFRDSTEPMWGTLGTRGLDEVPLCPHCLARLRPDAHFCKRCLAPVSSYASFGYFGQGNYEAIWSTAWIFHQAIVTPAPRRAHFLGVLLAFAPGLVSSAAWLSRGNVAFPGAGGALGHWLVTPFLVLFGGLWVYIPLAFIWRAWRNLKRTPPIEDLFE